LPCSGSTASPASNCTRDIWESFPPLEKRRGASFLLASKIRHPPLSHTEIRDVSTRAIEEKNASAAQHAVASTTSSAPLDLRIVSSHKHLVQPEICLSEMICTTVSQASKGHLVVQ